jgi:hypothetical protein
MVLNMIEEIHEVMVFGGVLAETNLGFLLAAVVLVEDQRRHSSFVRLLSRKHRHLLLKVFLRVLVAFFGC